MLVETSSFTMYPKVLDTDDVEVETSNELTYQEKQEQMLSRFGSKRANQAMKQRRIYEVGYSAWSQKMSIVLELGC